VENLVPLSQKHADERGKNRHKKNRTRRVSLWSQQARNNPLANLYGAGDRRTVVGREGPIFAGLEFGGVLAVPHRVSIKKSASYGFPWNRIRNF